MLPGKGKHGFKKTGKGGKDLGKVVASSSKPTKDMAPVKLKVGQGESSDDREGVVTTLPLFKTADNSRMLPRYTAVLARSEVEGVGMEDLDTLQLELEALLSCVAVRNRVLREEIKQLETVEEKRDKNKKLALVKREKPGPPARHEERPVKKLKETIKTETQTGGKLSKLKPELPSRDSPKPDAPKIVMQKNDTPNKFWQAIEPYCANITDADMNHLKEMIQEREEEKDSELMKTPPLGRHYSQRWAEEDLGEDVRAGLDLASLPDKVTGTAGPLTQRLLSALIDDKSSPLQETNENKMSNTSSRDTREVTLTGHRSSVLKNVQSLAFERRVRKELRDHGILDADEAPKEQNDDELLLEIKRVQADLHTISQHNLQQLRNLHAQGEKEMARQELKRKIKVLDVELLNIYATKQKKKQLTIKEKDQAWRFIKERESLLKLL